MMIIRKQLSWRDHHCFAAPLLIALDVKKHPVIDKDFTAFNTEDDDLVYGKTSAVEDSTLFINPSITQASMQENFSPNARAPVAHRQFKHAIYAATFLVFSILLLYSIFLDFQISSTAISSPTDHIVAFTNSTVGNVEF